MNRPIKTKSGTLSTTQEEQMKRWEEHFSEIFSKEDNKTGSKQEIRNVQENSSGEKSEIDLDPPTKNEIELAITKLKNCKSLGIDNINS
jgi:hypothetical protein